MPFALTVFMRAYAYIEIKKFVGAPPKIGARVLENQRYFLPWPYMTVQVTCNACAFTQSNAVHAKHVKRDPRDPWRRAGILFSA